jgi:outer membrane translocation and assembly module TamA
VANADYRLPLWHPERGIGAWPIFVQTFHGSVFADAGTVWTRRASASALKWDVGAELAVNVVLGYFVPVTLTTGAAWGHDRSRSVEDGWRIYLRLGRAF